MIAKKLAFIDFETEAIVDAPAWKPPKPVGLSLAFGEHSPDYLPFDQPEQLALAINILGWLTAEGYSFVGHNISGFDLPVAQRHLDILRTIPPERVIDTKHLAAILCHKAPSLSLKALAQSELGEIPEAQSAVRDWLIANKVVARNDKNWGAHICKAPVELVAPYANKDVAYTKMLCEQFLDTIDPMERVAFEREQKLAPILNSMTSRGVHLNVGGAKLVNDALVDAIDQASSEIRAILDSPDLNIDSNDDLADALEAAGKATQFPKTPTGRRKVDRASLRDCVTDLRLREVLEYRGIASTMLNTFVGPWLVAATVGGRIHPQWNSLRSEAGGTRTGRIAGMRPNFANIPKAAPDHAPTGYAPLPAIRKLLLPGPGRVWVSADFDSQELRVLAHFAGGKLEQLFKDDPKLDLHSHMVGLIKQIAHLDVTRKQAKIVAFSIIYGAGDTKLAGGLLCGLEEAQTIRRAYYKALPGLEAFLQDVMLRARQGKSVRTWGGRQLYAPVDEKTGRPRDYALTNYLIQGSSADLTKDAIVRFSHHDPSPILTTVYDEINIAPLVKNGRDATHALVAAMTAPRLAVPLTVTVTAGPSWGELK